MKTLSKHYEEALSVYTSTEALSLWISRQLTDLLTALREYARSDKNFLLSDLIRNELDTRGSFCMDGPVGQVVYHMGSDWTRQRLIQEIQYVNDSFKFNYYAG